MTAQIARPTHRMDAAELADLQRDSIKTAKLIRLQQAGGIVTVFIDFHGQPCRLPDSGTFFERRTGLFKHDVQITHRPADAGGIQLCCPTIPVTIDERAGANRFTHQPHAGDIGFIVLISTKLGLELANACCIGLFCHLLPFHQDRHR